jgi:hypothetical protein
MSEMWKNNEHYTEDELWNMSEAIISGLAKM